MITIKTYIQNVIFEALTNPIYMTNHRGLEKDIREENKESMNLV